MIERVLSGRSKLPTFLGALTCNVSMLRLSFQVSTPIFLSYGSLRTLAQLAAKLKPLVATRCQGFDYPADAKLEVTLRAIEGANHLNNVSVALTWTTVAHP